MFSLLSKSYAKLDSFRNESGNDANTIHVVEDNDETNLSSPDAQTYRECWNRNVLPSNVSDGRVHQVINNDIISQLGIDTFSQQCQQSVESGGQYGLGMRSVRHVAFSCDGVYKTSSLDSAYMSNLSQSFGTGSAF